MDQASTGASRRRIMGAGLGLVAAGSLPFTRPAAAAPPALPGPAAKTTMSSSTFAVKDGTQIYYKDWGSGQPIVFHHGWPLSSDEWDTQMLLFLSNGYRVIAHDRRGHGRSSQTASGNEMGTYAADVDALAAHLGLRDAIHVGHSTGGGEVARYVAQHGMATVDADVINKDLLAFCRAA